jgi:peptidoglycan/xylan/chitin deacetylase (PgdA/CDA1 family)
LDQIHKTETVGDRANDKGGEMLKAIPNKREFAAKMLKRLGLLRALEHIAAARNPGLAVLTYHRIAEPQTNRFYDPVISATPSSFRAQIDWLCKHTQVLTLEALIDHVQDNSLCREPTVLITFDDGYRDNFDVALPILAERNVPATFFIPTAFLETPQLPWWDHVAYIIKRAQARCFTLPRSLQGNAPPLEINLERTSRSAATMAIIQALLDRTVDDERRFLDELASRAKVTVDGESLGRALFMSWDQVCQLAKPGSGFTIGSHSHSHANLARLDENLQRRELAVSKQILETRVGRKIEAFAYPYGWPGTYTSITKAIVAETDYRVAFASREGITQRETLDPWEISRLGVGSGDSAILLRARMALHATFGRSVL